MQSLLDKLHSVLVYNHVMCSILIYLSGVAVHWKGRVQTGGKTNCQLNQAHLVYRQGSVYTRCTIIHLKTNSWIY
jgi:hypothetical protein